MLIKIAELQEALIHEKDQARSLIEENKELAIENARLLAVPSEPEKKPWWKLW